MQFYVYCDHYLNVTIVLDNTVNIKVLRLKTLLKPYKPCPIGDEVCNESPCRNCPLDSQLESFIRSIFT